MKSNFLFSLLSAGVMICIGLALAGANDGGNSNAPVLSGHEKKSEDLPMAVTDIIIAKFTSLGNENSDSPGASFYEKADIECLSSLKGTLVGNIQAGYTVHFFPPSERETVPVIGTQYIMFIQKLGPTEYEIKKLLLATEQNVASVKALITSSSGTAGNQ
jgi:hypothetical protein